MTKIFKTEIVGEPVLYQKLVDFYENVWQVTKVCEHYVLAAKIERGQKFSNGGKMLQVHWNPTLRKAMLEKVSA